MLIAFPISKISILTQPQIYKTETKSRRKNIKKEIKAQKQFDKKFDIVMTKKLAENAVVSGGKISRKKSKQLRMISS